MMSFVCISNSSTVLHHFQLHKELGEPSIFFHMRGRKVVERDLPQDDNATWD